MKLRKIIALSTAVALLAGTGITLGITLGNRGTEPTPPIVDSDFEFSNGISMSWEEVISKKYIKVENNVIVVVDEDKLCG